MTNEKWNEAIAKEEKARAEAIALLCQAAGVPLLSLKIIEDGSDCTVEAMFKYGARHWGSALCGHQHGRPAHGALGHPATDPGAQVERRLICG